MYNERILKPLALLGAALQFMSLGGCKSPEIANSQRNAGNVSAKAGASKILDTSWFEGSTESIDEFTVPNSKIVLIHIRQQHRESVEEFDSISQDTLIIQDRMFDILESLFYQHRFNALYPEGVFNENEANLNHQLREIRKRCAPIYFDPKFERPSFGLPQFYQNSFSQVKSWDAAAAFAVAHNINFGAAEDKVACERFEAILRYTSQDDQFFRAREIYFLKKILEEQTSKYSGKPLYVVTTFGSGHNFRDDIAECNHADSSKKISLIEITPKGVPCSDASESADLKKSFSWKAKNE